MLGIFARLKMAAGQALVFFIVAGLAVGAAVWAFNNPAKFTAVAGSWGNAAASVAITTGDWVAQKAGGSAATTGPEVIYVHNEAPNRWHVGAAIRVWNKGLTNVQLQAVAECPSDGTCFEVSQVSELPPTDGRLTLGKTHTFINKSIEFNGAAVGHVSPALFPVAACHELGHALGAEHSASMKSCMHASVAAGVSTRPAKADYAAVNDKYGH